MACCAIGAAPCGPVWRRRSSAVFRTCFGRGESAPLEVFEAREPDAELSTPADAPVAPLRGADGSLRFEVDRLHRSTKGVEEMFVHWKGYDASHGRWVSRASLLQDVPALVAAYDANPSVLVPRLRA